MEASRKTLDVLPLAEIDTKIDHYIDNDMSVQTNDW